MKTKSSFESQSGEILKRHLAKLKKQNRAFSLRSLAAKVDVSHTFLSRVLNGKAKLPRTLVEDLITTLKIDVIDATTLRSLFEPQEQQAHRSLNFQDTSNYEVLPEGHLRIMRKWWNLAILDLLTCELPTTLTADNIHLFLPVSQSEIRKSIDELISLGLVKIENKRLQKGSTFVRIPARGPNEFTRSFYRQTLSLAAKELDRTSVEAYNSRSILGFTCAVNSRNIPVAKQRFAAGLRECVKILSEGDCDELFLVQGQMFSVLKS